MKKQLMICCCMLFCVLLVLSGCTGRSTPPSGDSARQTGEAGNTLPLSVRLALGTLKLENTAQAVTAQQAAHLLPLWKAARNLTPTENAIEEINAVYNQLQDTMTAEQMAAIQATSSEEFQAFAKSIGVNVGIGIAGNGGKNGNRDAAAGAGGQMGGGPGGAGGMQMLMGSGGPPPDMMTGGTTNKSNDVGKTLAEAVINLLKKKVSK